MEHDEWAIHTPSFDVPDPPDEQDLEADVEDALEAFHTIIDGYEKYHIYDVHLLAMDPHIVTHMREALAFLRNTDPEVLNRLWDEIEQDVLRWFRGFDTLTTYVEGNAW